MSKASSVYILMLLIFIGGLWTIVSIGSFLQAPEDFDGAWDLIPTDSPRSDAAFSGPLLILQSGKYVNLRFESGEMLNMKQATGEPTPGGEPARAILMRNEQWQMAIEGLRDSGERRMILTGPERKYSWTARRAGIEEAAHNPVVEPIAMAPAIPTSQPTAVDARD